MTKLHLLSYSQLGDTDYSLERWRRQAQRHEAEQGTSKETV